MADEVAPQLLAMLEDSVVFVKDFLNCVQYQIDLGPRHIFLHPHISIDDLVSALSELAPLAHLMQVEIPLRLNHFILKLRES